MYLIFGIIAGSFTTISNIFNSRTGRKIGILQGVLINFITGLSVSILLAIFNIKVIKLALTVTDIPIYVFLGGILGVAIVCIINIIMPKIPVVYTALIIFIGQIITGCIIDFFIFDKFSLGRLIGIVFVILGLFINSMIDKKGEQNDVNRV